MYHAQLATYTVFHVESESAVRIDQFLDPDETTKTNNNYKLKTRDVQIYIYTHVLLCFIMFWHVLRGPSWSRRPILLTPRSLKFI